MPQCPQKSSSVNKCLHDEISNPFIEEREQEEIKQFEQGIKMPKDENIDHSDDSEGPVPQIEIGPDGNIKIAEKSLVC